MALAGRGPLGCQWSLDPPLQPVQVCQEAALGICVWIPLGHSVNLESQQDSPPRLSAEHRLEVMNLVTGTLSTGSGLAHPQMLRVPARLQTT